MLNLNFKRSPIKWTALTFAVSLAIIFSKSSFCEEKNSLNFIDDIPLMESMKIEPELSKDVLKVFDLSNSVNSKKSFGGTSFDNIKKMIMKYKREI